VREPAGRERGVRELEHDPRRHAAVIGQNSEYRCASGKLFAGSQVSNWPSARTV
jgi:hypothetical protein